MELSSVLIAAGGTGGHIIPALAIGEEIRNRFPNARILFVGTHRGLEQKLIPAAGFPLKTISSRGWIRGWAPLDLFRNLLIPFALILGILQSWWVLLRRSPQMVIGCGGYVTAPVGLLAACSRARLVLQEQNSRPGRTTLLLSRWADRIHVSYDDAVRFFPRTDRVRVTGNPLRSGLAKVERSSAAASFGLDPSRLILLTVGGSLGSRAINQALLEAAPAVMRETNAQILWQTGRLDFDRIQRETSSWGRQLAVMAFIDAMTEAYSCADLVLCRAGAMTISELTAMGLPSVLVPYPHAADNHQEHNAMSLVRRDAAVLVRDTELKDRLKDVLLKLLKDDAARKDMANCSARLGRPQAVKDIVDDLIDLVSP